MKKTAFLFTGGRGTRKLLIINYALLICLYSCSVSRPIDKQAKRQIINDSILAAAHIGISLYDATGNKYLYNYQGDKYFIPASNTKIFTCYAAMKYLGDSLVGLRYEGGNDSVVAIYPTGDPTFLHSDFKNQPVYNFLKKFKYVEAIDEIFADEYIGKGWSWDDYQDDYMVQRSSFPIYGNMLSITANGDSVTVIPSLFKNYISYSGDIRNGFRVDKSWDDNHLFISEGVLKHVEMPFRPYPPEEWRMLADTLHAIVHEGHNRDFFPGSFKLHTIHSQPTDSLLKIMMHRSDNFYAEQSLLMVSNEKLGVMNDKKIIDTLLSTDLKELPQQPQWVDGSGLSRYNLFTPQDFIFILNKMRNEYSWQRITTIFSTGGDGTLGNYYKGLKGKIFAKTGSLSNNIALSGYIITKKNKTVIFSVLVGNFVASSSEVRKAVEHFLTAVQQEY